MKKKLAIRETQPAEDIGTVHKMEIKRRMARDELRKGKGFKM